MVCGRRCPCRYLRAPADCVNSAPERRSNFGAGETCEELRSSLSGDLSQKSQKPIALDRSLSYGVAAASAAPAPVAQVDGVIEALDIERGRRYGCVRLAYDASGQERESTRRKRTHDATRSPPAAGAP